MRDGRTRATATMTVAVIGNPNSGKTTLFNALTGLRQRVGNFPGVTVEKKEGRVSLPGGTDATLIDLPGTYSMHAASPDELLATDILLGRTHHTPAPDLVLCVVDATNIERNLYLVTQLLDRHIPVVVALTMVDLAALAGIHIDMERLSARLRSPVIPVIAHRGQGIQELRTALAADRHPNAHASEEGVLPEAFERAFRSVQERLRETYHMSPPAAAHEAIELLTSPEGDSTRTEISDPAFLEDLRNHIQKLDFLGIDRQTVLVESRYTWIRNVVQESVRTPDHSSRSVSDRIDRIVTHRFWGFLLFLAVMALMFQSIFSWATYPMEWIGNAFDWLGRQATALMPPGDLRDLAVNGALAGVAAVVTFLPQIAFLFLFLGILEDSGYMARAAFIMDKLMGKVGLHGKSFIPLLGSFACAIPGIMATRTIENPKDRLATIMVAPLMSCSARLPIYSLLIAAFIPGITVLGIFSLQGLTLLSLYLFGMIMALVAALVFKKTLLRGAPPLFLMELPPYKLPALRSVLALVWERSLAFLKTAGTIILGVSILLWALATYPKLDTSASAADQLKHSYAGRAGTAIEPVLEPLGFDWKIGIGLISSMLQREAFVSAMATIYNLNESGDEGTGVSLREAMQSDRDPATGLPTFTTLTAICLMVYYVLAMQCLSTVAVVRRETNSWRWPLLQIVYMTALAYGMTFLVYRFGLLIGWGGG